MKWKKLGYSFKFADHKLDWQKSHNMMPVVLETETSLRVYYTTRHIDGKSRASFIDVDKRDPRKVLYVHPVPVLEVGEVGSFDDCGTVVTFVIRVEDKIYLYYNGYNVRNTVPWSNSIGLAVSEDNGYTFKKMYNGPVMDRWKNDAYFAITPCIIKQQGTWHMWYTSGIGWVNVENRVEPLYDIKYAKSENGIDWIRDFQIGIPQSDPEECTARATILQRGESLYMWFIYRGSRDFRDGKDSYRIGYAEGNINEPTKWIRMDGECGINPGPEEYDFFMQAYPCVVSVGDKVYMFYNGNGFGVDGVLCAEMEENI